MLVCSATRSSAGASSVAHVALLRNMSSVKQRMRRMREDGKRDWYAIVYFAMCFAAAAFQEKSRMRGVVGAGCER